MNDDKLMINGVESSENKLPIVEKGSKKCLQIDKKQHIEVNTTSGIKQYTMIFNVYVDDRDDWKTLIGIAEDLSDDSALFIGRSTGLFGVSKIGYSGYKVPIGTWCKLIFTYDFTDDNNRQIVSYLRYRNENNEILHNKHIHKTDHSAIPKTFTLSNKAKLFYDESDDDGTIYSNYFKLIENRILTETEVKLLTPEDTSTVISEPISAVVPVSTEPVNFIYYNNDSEKLNQSGSYIDSRYMLKSNNDNIPPWIKLVNTTRLDTPITKDGIDYVYQYQFKTWDTPEGSDNKLILIGPETNPEKSLIEKYKENRIVNSFNFAKRRGIVLSDDDVNNGGNGDKYVLMFHTNKNFPLASEYDYLTRTGKMKDAVGNDISNSLLGLELNDKMDNYTSQQAESLMTRLYAQIEKVNINDFNNYLLGNDKIVSKEQRTFVYGLQFKIDNKYKCVIPLRSDKEKWVSYSGLLQNYKNQDLDFITDVDSKINLHPEKATQITEIRNNKLARNYVMMFKLPSKDSLLRFKDKMDLVEIESLGTLDSDYPKTILQTPSINKIDNLAWIPKNNPELELVKHTKKDGTEVAGINTVLNYGMVSNHKTR